MARLDLSRCHAINDISGIATCGGTLRSLDLSRCGSLEDINPLQSCTALEVLHLARSRKVVDIGPYARRVGCGGEEM